MNGFGLEFFIETPAEEIGSSLTDIKKSWQFQLLYTVSQLAAGALAGLRGPEVRTCRLGGGWPAQPSPDRSRHPQHKPKPAACVPAFCGCGV